MSLLTTNVRRSVMASCPPVTLMRQVLLAKLAYPAGLAGFFKRQVFSSGHLLM